MPRAKPDNGQPKPSFSCSQCGQCYSRIEYVKRHERRQHQDAKPFSCPKCPKSYSRSDVLLTHRRRCHPASFNSGISGSSSTGSAASAPSSTSSVQSSAPPNLPLPSNFFPILPPSSFSECIGFPLALPTSDAPLPAESPFRHESSPGALGLSRRQALGQDPVSDEGPGSVHPYHAYEADFFFDGLLSPTSLFPLPALQSARLPSSGPGPTSAEEAAYQETVHEIGHEQQGVIGSGAWLELERTVLGSEAELRKQRAQVDTYTVAAADPFYISNQKFSGCFYGVEHWQLPSLETLSIVARRTVDNIIPHVPFLHLPTFTLNSVPNCVGFAVSSCGRPMRRDRRSARLSNGNLRSLGPTEDGDAESWDGITSVVKSVKTDTLIKTFSRSRDPPFSEHNVGMLQALILYRISAFLSDAHEQRMRAYMHFGTIVMIARQVGIIDPDNEELKATQSFNCREPSLEAEWKAWIKAETARRTAWILFAVDTVASLECGCPLLVSAVELADVPLPCADTIWLAPDAVSWAEAVSSSPSFGSTLADGIGCIFVPPGGEEPSHLYQTKAHFGPFFLLCLILVVTREVIDVGEGRRQTASGHLPRWAWWAGDEDMPREISSALERWRRAWDLDALSPPAFSSTTSAGRAASIDSLPQDEPACTGIPAACACPLNGLGAAVPVAHGEPNSLTPSAGTPDKSQHSSYADVLFCQDAIPFYWLSKILVDALLRPSTPALRPGSNQFRAKGIICRDVLESARVFVIESRRTSRLTSPSPNPRLIFARS